MGVCFHSKPFPSVACNDWTTLTDQCNASRNIFLNRLLSSPTEVCGITFASSKFASIPGTAHSILTHSQQKVGTRHLFTDAWNLAARG